ncbi:hypothetical protein BGX29_005196, partial [Mortierella sp. GBA35]
AAALSLHCRDRIRTAQRAYGISARNIKTDQEAKKASKRAGFEAQRNQYRRRMAGRPDEEVQEMLSVVNAEEASFKDRLHAEYRRQSNMAIAVRRRAIEAVETYRAQQLAALRSSLEI